MRGDRWIVGAGSRILLLLALLVPGCVRAAPDAGALDWLDAPVAPEVSQVGAGELEFLTTAPGGRFLHSVNRLVIDERSLADGWVALEQCYRGLDPVAEAEIVYAYDDMRGLRVLSQAGIGKASAHASSIELEDVSDMAQLCVAADVRILSRSEKETYTLRNGPFHRRFLDGYFPMRVTLEVRFPADRLRLLSVAPAAQPGLHVEQDAGRLDVDALFAGALTIQASFVIIGSPPVGE